MGDRICKRLQFLVSVRELNGSFLNATLQLSGESCILVGDARLRCQTDKYAFVLLAELVATEFFQKPHQAVGAGRRCQLHAQERTTGQIRSGQELHERITSDVGCTKRRTLRSQTQKNSTVCAKWADNG